MKLKEALVKAEKIPASENKRGRPSEQYQAWGRELAAQGWDIEGYSTPKVEARPTVQAEKPKAKPKSDFAGVVDVPDEARSESLWTAWVGKVQVGMRTVCNLCNNSLTYCRCEKPRVWVDHDRQGVVEFRPTREKR